jgi:hypothetical protein
MRVLLTTLIIFLISSIAFGEEGREIDFDAMYEFFADDEIARENTFLNTWIDPEAMERLSKTRLTDDSAKSLYSEFKNTIPDPPNPDTYKEYGIENGEEVLVKVDKLGRLINTMIRAIPDEDIKKYGELFASMRDVLVLDVRHIPLAIEHDNSRDVYWYELHNIRLKKAEEIYIKTLGKKN